MSTDNRVFIARKSCGCIVAAIPVNMDKAIKGKILEQLTKAGYDIEQATDTDVRLNFALRCVHSEPPLLAYERVMRASTSPKTEPEGVDQKDVDAAGTDLTPEAEEAEAKLEAEEAKDTDHQAEADTLLNNFLEKKEDQEEDDEDSETQE